jgi:hypothetical protein
MKGRGSAIVAGVWLVSAAAGFWHWSLRYALPVEAPVGRKAADRVPAELAGLLSAEESTVFFAWNPDCPCTAADEPHVRELMSRWPELSWVVVAPDSGHEAESRKRKLSGRFLSGMAGKLGLWAAPAAVIAASDGRILYRGGINAFRFCTREDGQLLRRALEDLEAGRPPRISSGPFYGCPIPGARRSLP